tara:strand:+ start:159327 stop:159482 length:156 start_codon:yes stop_codon:yes gene_type:complete
MKTREEKRDAMLKQLGVSKEQFEKDMESVRRLRHCADEFVKQRVNEVLDKD